MNGANVFEPGDDVYDERAVPAFFENVVSRRIIAFLVDAVIIFAIMAVMTFALIILGIMTFGLLFPLIALVFPISALGYTAMTLGGRESATVGMRIMDLEMRTLYGAPMYPLLAAAHALVFYFSISLLTPLILLFALFNGRRRLLHDHLCGTVVVNRLREIGYD